MLLMQSGSPSAKLIEHLPNGQLQLTIFEQQLSIPEDEARWVQFWPIECTPTEWGDKRVSILSDAVDDPKVADCLENAINEKRYVTLNFWFDPRVKRPLFLGALPINDRSRFLKIEILLSRKNSPYQIINPTTDPAKSTSFRANLMKVDEYGYQVYPGRLQPTSSTLSGTNHDPNETAFVLEATKRKIKSDHPLIITCRWIGSSERECKTWLTVGNGQLAVNAAWYELHIPQKDWRDIDTFMVNTYQAISINKPYGELN